ncbi:LacI family transcriptional regulator [Humibacillus sp. DSM 29435]|nr:LacI family transcriptional regulator [Humibacillus sp. DSM 29435]
MERRRAARLKDVAELAGVSHQTVSRVVNRADGIRPETRERVEQAIARLDYHPNPAARNLVRGRSGTLGIITTDTGQFGPASIQRALEMAAREAGYLASSLVLSSVRRVEFDSAVEQLARLAVEGIVVIAVHDDALDVVRSRAGGPPVVLVEGDLSGSRRTVGVDQVAGARAATRHLLDLGHTEIAHVTGPLEWAEAKARRDGWRLELEHAGVTNGEVFAGDWSAASGYRAGRLITVRGRATAVFAANDQMAVGVLQALHQEGVRVPEDVSVVGFDDIPEAAFLIPPLSTVRQDFRAVGQRAIESLTAAIRGGPEPRPRLIDPELVVRASSGPVSRGVRP